MLESLFKKVAGPQACNFIEKRFQHSCFPVKFAKFFRAHFFTEGLWWLLFKISNSNNPTICSKIFHQYPLRTKNIGNRTIAPWIITPRTIVPRIIAPRTIAPQTIGPQDNCPLDNCPLKIASPEIVPQVISPWTTGAQTIATQNNIDY